MARWSSPARRAALAGAVAFLVSVLALAGDAQAEDRRFDIPPGALEGALNRYVEATGAQLVFRSRDVVGLRSAGVSGTFSPDAALGRLIAGTGLSIRRMESGAVGVVPGDLPVMLDEILVTARKRPEPLDSIPISLTVYGVAAREQLDLNGVQDLQLHTPGLWYANQGSRYGHKLQIRGLTTGTNGASKASVFIDGVYVAGDYSGVNFAELERIEVLRGPQSAVFGRATFAGAVNYITLNPTTVLSGRFEASAAEFGEHSLSALVAGPVHGDDLLGQVSVSRRRVEGPFKNSDGGRLGYQRTWDLGAKLLWLPRAGLSVKGSATYNTDEDGLLPVLFPAASRRNGAFVTPRGTVSYYPVGEAPALDFSYPSLHSFNDLLEDPGIHRRVWRASVSAEGQWREHAITATASSNLMRETVELDYSYGGSVPFYTRPTLGKVRDDSLEVRVNSPIRRFRYGLGYYHLDLYRDNHSIVFNRVRIETWAQTTTTNDALFGSAFFDLTAKLSLSGEARYQVEQVETLNPLTGLRLAKAFPAMLPRVSVTYALTDAMHVYATVSKGNTSGQFNTGMVNTADQRVVGEETLNNYEAGFRASWFDDRLRIDAAAYVMHWNNQQTTSSYFIPTGGNFSVVENKGSSRIAGFELEVAAQPRPGVDLRASLSHQDARYEHFCSTNFGAILGRSDVPAPTVCVYVDGNRLEATPAWQLSLTGGYTRPLAGSVEGFVRGEYIFNSRIYDSEMNLAYSPAANLFNLRLGLQSGKTTAEVFVRNLTNERSPLAAMRASDVSISASNTTNQSVAETPRKPRTVGVRLGYAF